MKRELKHLLTITLILLGGNINCYSQKKELKKEKDGFQWYQLFTDDILRDRWHITEDEWKYIDSRIHNYGGD